MVLERNGSHFQFSASLTSFYYWVPVDKSSVALRTDGHIAVMLTMTVAGAMAPFYIHIMTQ